MSLQETPAEISANLEYPACPMCESERREFPFRLSATGRIDSFAPAHLGLSASPIYVARNPCGSIRRGEHEPYKVTRCVECGLHYLYPRLIESAMQEVYRQSSYYEGGACGYADTSYTAQEFALRATFKRLLRNLAKRGLTGGDLLEIG